MRVDLCEIHVEATGFGAHSETGQFVARVYLPGGGLLFAYGTTYEAAAAVLREKMDLRRVGVSAPTVEI